MHPSYSPDLAPSDYYLFHALQNSLDGKKLSDRDAAQTHLGKFFNNKQQKFYTDGIMKLPEKWQKVIDNNGQYVLDLILFLIKKCFVQNFLLKPRILFI